MDILHKEDIKDFNFSKRVPMWGRTDYHCELCGCPIDIWTPMETYKSDRCCELYYDFADVVEDLEDKKENYNYDIVLRECLKFKSKYTDIPDFEASLKEMIDADVDTGVMTKLYISNLKSLKK